MFEVQVLPLHQIVLANVLGIKNPESAASHSVQRARFRLEVAVGGIPKRVGVGDSRDPGKYM